MHFQNITCGQETTVLRRLRCNPSPRLLLSMVHQERVGTTYNGVKFLCEASLSTVPSGEPLVNNKPITSREKMTLILKLKIVSVSSLNSSISQSVLMKGISKDLRLKCICIMEFIFSANDPGLNSSLSERCTLCVLETSCEWGDMFLLIIENVGQCF